jgi:phosphoserine phosphatase
MGEYTKPSDAVIFDVDGTLANCDHRRHLVEGKKKYFDKFYDAMNDDTVREEIRGLCNMYYMVGWRVIICTGRPELYAGVTERWLTRHGVFFHELMMRPNNRRTDPDYEVKQDMLNEILKTRKVHLAVDDRKQVVDMWRRNGITCLQCADGDF